MTIFMSISSAVGTSSNIVLYNFEAKENFPVPSTKIQNLHVLSRRRVNQMILKSLHLPYHRIEWNLAQEHLALSILCAVLPR